MMCATALQAQQGYPDAFSVSFLLLGVTSVIHHSRLDAWWKRDLWRVLDYAACLTFAAVAFATFQGHPILIGTCVVVLAISASIWTVLVAEANVPAAHACVHILVDASALWLKQR